MFVALACNQGGTDTPNKSENAAPEQSSTEGNAENTSKQGETVADEPVDQDVPEPTPDGPERISFKKGMSEGTITVALAPNEKKKYVVGVTYGQHFYVEVEDFRPIIKVLSTSKLTDIDEGESSFYGVTTKDGDIVFEIENPTRNSIKTTAKISINTKVY